MSKHTPTPWRADAEVVPVKNPRTGLLMIRAESGGTVAGVIAGNGRTDANAEMICRAVNNYENMLAACKEARSVIAAAVMGAILGHKPLSTAEAEINHVVDVLDAAIARAEGGG